MSGSQQHKSGPISERCASPGEASAPEQTHSGSPPLRPVRWRVVLLATALAVIGIASALASEIVQPTLNRTINLPWLVLFVFTALGPFLSARLGLEGRDTLVVFCFLLIATVVCDAVNRLLPCYTALQYFATPDNKWQTLFDAHVPGWFVPRDPEVIRAFFEGTPDVTGALRAWALPATLWVGFFMVFWGTLFCIVALLRRHWVEHEHLSFPLVTVPLYITGSGSRRMRPATTIWREPLMWVGFAASSLHFASIMLHALTPSFPTIGTHTELGPLFTERPWNAIAGLFFMDHSPSTVGLAYFAPQDVCFTMWFSYLCYILPLRVIYSALGLREPSGFPYYWEQGAGAFVAVALIYGWLARPHLRRVWRAARSGMAAAQAGERHPWADPLAYRWALVGLAVGFCLLCAWYVAAGMSWWVAVLFFGLVLAFATVYTRGRAEAGIASLVSFPLWQANTQLRSFLGSERLSPGGNLANMTLLGSLVFLHFGLFPNGMTYQMEGLKLAEESRVNISHVSTVIILAAFVGLVTGFASFLTLFNEYGANSLQGGTTEGGYYVWLARNEYNNVSQVANGSAIAPDWHRNAYTITAGAIVALLFVTRTHIPRSPFSPVGFAMCMPYGYAYWWPFLVAWVVKSLILRFGGGRLYSRLVPVFIGLVLGQVFWVALAQPLAALVAPPGWVDKARLTWYLI